MTRRDSFKMLGAGAALAQSGQLARAREAPDETVDADRERRMKWWHEAQFGMFIHWGPYSVAGVEASWPIMVPSGEISEADYRALPARFNPVLFNPNAWIDLARNAGQRYLVFTTKRHDGFCMFDSDYTSYKITRTP